VSEPKAAASNFVHQLLYVNYYFMEDKAKYKKYKPKVYDVWSF